MTFDFFIIILGGIFDLEKENIMPQHKSAKKRVKTNLKSAGRNRHYRSTMKSAIKKVVETEDKVTAEANLKKTISLLDKMVTKKIIHKNKAANQKSRLTKYVNKLEA